MESIDVVIPTYNEYERLLTAVCSALSQTVEVNTIFIIDDGSNHEIRSRLKTSWLVQEEKVHLVLIDHVGLPGVLRKIGVELSTAKWIAFLDADDTWRPQKLEKQLHVAKFSRTELICSGATVIDKEFEKPVSRRFTKDAQKVSLCRLLWRNVIVNSSVLASREALLEVGTYADSNLLRGVEDYATWLRLVARHPAVYLIEELVEYKYSNVSLSRTEKNRRPEALSDFKKWIRETKSLSSRFVGYQVLVLAVLAVETMSRVARYLSDLKRIFMEVIDS
jgi:glycosyltransferase involved in cell wall biosynthesis